MMPDAQPMDMASPEPAMDKRRMLAAFYDKETANTLELAQFAHDAGLKSAFSNLLGIAQRQRRYAEQARKRVAIHDAIAKITGMPPPAPPEQAAGPAPADMTGTMPHYACGTGEMPHYAGGTGRSSLLGDPQFMSLQQRQNIGTYSGVPQPPEMPGQVNAPWWRIGPAEGADATSPDLLAQIAERQGQVAAIRGAHAMGWNDYTPAGVAPGTHPGGPAVVGEQGPEVVNLPAGSTVTPNPVTVLEMLHNLGWRPPGYAFGTGDLWQTAFATPGSNTTAMDANRSPSGITAYNDQGQFSGNQLQQGIQGAATEQGVYDPLGSERGAQIAKQVVLSGMGARQAQAATLADLYAAGDPAFRAYQRENAAANTQSQAADAYLQARADEARRAEEFARGAYGMSTTGAINRRDPKAADQLAAIGGQVAGAVTGAALGGLARPKQVGTTGGQGPTTTPWYYGR